jgi:hypothetical protein
MLHDLCKKAGAHLPRLMERLEKKGNQVHLLTKDNVNTGNNQGNTPAHVLWQSHKKAEDNQIDPWDAMQILFTFGADIGIRNKAGVSVFENMLSAIEARCAPRAASHIELWAQLQAAHLGAKTSPSFASYSRTFRL